MERKLALWFGYPFLVLAGMLIALNLIAPWLISGPLLAALTIWLSIVGIALTAIHAFAQMRLGESPLVALSSVAVIVVATGVSFYKEAFVMTMGLLQYASMDT